MLINEMRTEELLALGMFGRGSRLGERIEMLLVHGRDFSPRASVSRVAASAVAMLACVIAGSFAPRLIAFAQTAPQFEVASVKPNPWTGQGCVGCIDVHGNTLTTEHVDLKDLISFAYDLRDPIQLSGGPAWAAHGMLVSSDFYQVIAKAGGDPAPSTDQFRLMLQELLADRFKLKVHHINKDLPVYNLVVGKNGSKLKESAVDAKFSANVRSLGRQGIRMTATHAPLANLLEQVRNYAGRPVFDMTGLSGFYDFETEWVQDGAAAAGQDAYAPDSSAPSLFTAIQQLGLKLEPGVAQFDTVVIDHAEKPDAN